jgi:class 3 adenylate cyclase
VKPRFPLFYKITGASFFVVLSVLAFVAVLDYRDQSRALEDKFGLTLAHIAGTAALFVDGDAHDHIHANADAAGADFGRLRNVLDRVRRENDLGEDQVYTLRPLGGDQYEFVAMLQAKTFVGDRYTPPPATREIARWVLADGKPRYTPLYRDEHGHWISGYGAVRDGAGRVVGLLEVDYDIGRYMAELDRVLARRLWIVPVALLIALVLSALVARSISRAVARLVTATDAVRRGEYDGEVSVPTRDELRTLADAFNIMLGGLRERFAMLKFVPSHTRAVIAESAKKKAGDVEFVAETRDVCVFFSDIRGFTALSDAMSPDRVIHMLNIYLRKEAEIIERHKGSIDKFIGDAVMAVFEGADRFTRAVAAAVEIQETIAALNTVKAFEKEVEVGIGIAGGEVVMGSVGYEARMEFAVIGRLVNLASRLCSVAGRGEIVVSEEAWKELGDRYQGERRSGLKLKGFAAEISCWKVSGIRDPAAASQSGSTSHPTRG